MSDESALPGNVYEFAGFPVYMSSPGDEVPTNGARYCLLPRRLWFVDKCPPVHGVDHQRWLSGPGHGLPSRTWCRQHAGIAARHVPRWVAAVRQHFGHDRKYACVGEGFGGMAVLDLLAMTLVSGGVIANPINLDEGSLAEIQHPLFLSRGLGADDELSFEEVHLLDFSWIPAAFAADDGDDDVEEYQRSCREQCVRGIITWLDLHLGVRS
ncbi:hypothetical protein B0H66DRAFT_537392 [Apodospora peruviana]|uniref:Uncharacterized protein n=1 Tax=Apodospora peruviana TaxID=516989 RepID=A0AAE0HX14_9PEZI|nr:hypothetical protein B0H66DRAFT_537392 [Apodospora peruviana]